MATAFWPSWPPLSLPVAPGALSGALWRNSSGSRSVCSVSGGVGNASTRKKAREGEGRRRNSRKRRERRRSPKKRSATTTTTSEDGRKGDFVVHVNTNANASDANMSAAGATSKEDMAAKGDQEGEDANAKPKWDGIKLAKEAARDGEEEEEAATASASATASATAAGDAKTSDGAAGAALSRDDRRASSSSTSTTTTSATNQEERLLEELVRLRLASQPEATASQLPPKQRIQLYQPRTKLEQFEDILMESQLLEQSGFTAGLEEALAAAAASVSNTAGASNSSSSSPLDEVDLELLRQCGSSFDAAVDFEVSDAIFNDNLPIRKTNSNSSEGKDSAKASSFTSASGDASAGSSGDDAQQQEGQQQEQEDSSSSSRACGCSPCHERLNIENEQVEEVERLRVCWSELRAEVAQVRKEDLWLKIIFR